MIRLRSIAAVLAAACLSLPEKMLAQVGDGISAVSGQLNEGIGGGEFGGIVQTMMESFLPLVNVTATLFIVIFGMWMILAETEDQRTTARKVVVTIVISLVLLNLSAVLAEIFINWDNGGGERLTDEVLGIIRFVETPLAIAAIFIILITGIRAIITFGSEEGSANLRKTIIAIMLGMLLLSFKFLITEDYTQTFRPEGQITMIMTVVNIFTGFVGTLAVAVIVYAGFLMIVNVGNDEQYTRAKGIILRVAIGIAILLLSVGILNAVLEVNIFGLF